MGMACGVGQQTTVSGARRRVIRLDGVDREQSARSGSLSAGLIGIVLVR